MEQQQVPRPRIVIFCDGTWCGREFGTRTNIYLLTQILGLNLDDPNTLAPRIKTRIRSSPNQFTSFLSSSPSGQEQERDRDQDEEDQEQDQKVHIRYNHGVGLGSGFLDYLTNGITALDLAREVVEVYRFIVERYTPRHEIWMFGISRGAYTVRCVAGLIKNCGILRRRRRRSHRRSSTGGPDEGGEEEEEEEGEEEDEDVTLLAREAYRLYRSTNPLHDPHSSQMESFRKRNCWPLIGDFTTTPEKNPRPPIRFMGLFDTVGGLGIPTLGGDGFSWPEFHNTEISSVVQTVVHLLSVHDRIYIFQPCTATRKDGNKQGIEEEWLPGCHYDLARQKFQFWRPVGKGASWWEGITSVVSRIPILGWGKVIQPNEVLSDLALWKMLKRIGENDACSQLIPRSVLAAEMANLAGCMLDRGRNVGSGDVYENIAEYGPFGSPIGKVVKKIAGGLGLWKLFFEIRERVIDDDRAKKVYPFGSVDQAILGLHTVEQLAAITPERYPSQTAEAWALRSGNARPDD